MCQVSVDTEGRGHQFSKETLPKGGDRIQVFEDELMCSHEKGLPFFVDLENFCSSIKETQTGPPPPLAPFLTNS